MYKIKKSIVKKVNQVLEDQSYFSPLKLKSSRNREGLPAITYQYDEFAEVDDNVQNALLTLTLASSKEKQEIEHNKLIGHLKKKLNEVGFRTVENGETTLSGRFIFNSISDVSSQDDLIETSIIFDVRYFISEAC